MKRNTLFSFLTVAALGLLTAGPVGATNFTWDGSAGSDWQVAANWDQNLSYPQSGDIAIITTDGTPPVIDDQNEAVNELRVATGAVLTITGKKLTLGGTTAHDIDGDVVLSNATAILAFTDNVRVDGRGAIVGQDNSARVFITAGKTLTNEMIFKGHMKLLSTSTATNATFLNGSTGDVIADAAGSYWTTASRLRTRREPTGTPRPTAAPT